MAECSVFVNEINENLKRGGVGSRAKVQSGAVLLCKSAKVEARVQSTDYGVQSTEGGQAVGRCAANGRDAVAPLPAGEAREIGQHVVLSSLHHIRGIGDSG